MKKVELTTAMTYAGVNYEAGLNEMPDAAAKSAVRRKLGTAADEESLGEPVADSKAEQTKSAAPFEPLSFVDAMKRFEKTDFSDEVMKSLQHHEKTVREFRQSGMSPEDFLKKLADDDEAIQKLPLNFPMRHVFAKLGADYDSVEKIQAVSFEDLVAIDGIAEPSAKKALEYSRQESK